MAFDYSKKNQSKLNEEQKQEIEKGYEQFQIRKKKERRRKLLLTMLIILIVATGLAAILLT